MFHKSDSSLNKPEMMFWNFDLDRVDAVPFEHYKETRNSFSFNFMNILFSYVQHEWLNFQRDQRQTLKGVLQGILES